MVGVDAVDDTVVEELVVVEVAVVLDEGAAVVAAVVASVDEFVDAAVDAAVEPAVEAAVVLPLCADTYTRTARKIGIWKF